MSDLLRAEFAAPMEGLQLLGAAPKLAVAVSGGADSTALALLARDWVRARGGSLVCLIVDHGLRAASADEAEGTRLRLVERGLEARVLRLSGLSTGARLQEGARAMRHAALARAARAAGALFLLLGHHQGDQAETVAMRAKRGSGGLQGMAGFTARNDVVLLRPLLGIAPDRLRDFLRAEEMAWVEDPSNSDMRFERVRVRLDGVGVPPMAPEGRQKEEKQAAEFLGRRVRLSPLGFAVIDADAAPLAALAALLRVVGGANYAPRLEAVGELAGRLHAATLGGVRILPAGKLGPGWLLVREAAALAAAVPAVQGVIWDGRFRLMEPSSDASFGAVGGDATKFRHGSNLPVAVLRGLPCIRPANENTELRLAAVVFNPPGPAAPHPFLAASAGPD